MKRIALILLFILPLLAVGALGIRALTAPEDELGSVDLAALFPATFDGWKSEEVPLGRTEAESDSALKLLNLDTFVQRRYTNNGNSIIVYVAYWKPGRMDTRVIAAHNPDVCWVGNGWVCRESASREIVEVDGMASKPAEYRVYEMNGARVRVFYWLMVNNDSFVFRDFAHTVTSPVDYFTTFFHEVLMGKPAHYFIRISSDLPKDRLISSSLFAEIIKDLKQTGVAVTQ